MRLGAGGFPAADLAVNDPRGNPVQPEVGEECIVPPPGTDALRLRENQRDPAMSIAEQALRRPHAGLLRERIDRIDAFAQNIVAQENHRGRQSQNLRNLLLPQAEKRQNQQNRVPMHLLQEFHKADFGIRAEESAGKYPPRMRLHLFLDRRIELLQILRRPVVMNRRDDARIASALADEDSSGRFDPDLLLFLKPCEHLLDDPPRHPVPADQLADREKTLRHNKTVQLRLQRFVQAIRPMLNIT